MRHWRTFSRAAALLQQTIVVLPKLERLGDGEAWGDLDGIVIKGGIELEGGDRVLPVRIVSLLFGCLLLIWGILDESVSAGRRLFLLLLLLEQPGRRSQDLRLEWINGAT